MKQNKMLTYAILMVAMVFILTAGNHPYPGKVITGTPETALAMGMSTEEEKVEADQIQIQTSADGGKTKLYLFTKDDAEWVAFASADTFGMRYQLAFFELAELEADAQTSEYILQDHFREYTYELADGELVRKSEKFKIHDDILFTVLEFAIIVVMIVSAGRKQKKLQKKAVTKN